MVHSSLPTICDLYQSSLGISSPYFKTPICVCIPKSWTPSLTCFVFFLYSFLALVFVKSFLPISLSDRCRCAFLMATCIKAKGRADSFPTLYATKVLHNDGFEGWLTCCDLTKWWMSSHWQGGDLKYHLFFLWPLPTTLNFTASHSTVVFFFLHIRFHFLSLFPTQNSLFIDWGRHWGYNNKWGTKSGSHN